MSARWGLALFLGLPALFVAGLLVFLPRGGAFLAAPDEKELTRIASPDGRRTVTTAEIEGDATVGYGVEIRVGGEEAAMAYKPTRADGAYGVGVRWLDANTLEVAFAHARFVRVGKVPGLRVVVKGTTDPD